MVKNYGKLTTLCAIGSRHQYNIRKLITGTLTAVGDTLYFTANDGTNGTEL